MKKQTLYYTALLPLIAATLIACAWWSLHDNRALILRDQPLLQLSEAQKQAIRDLKGDITLEAYVRNNPRQRRGFADLVAPYKQLQPRLHLEFINPDSDPLRVQERDIIREGQLYLTDGTHGERIDIASPQSLATALLNLGESSDSQILHLQGHGERAWRQDSSGNWRAAYERIQNAKTTVGDQDQNRVRDIPRSTTLLVIADPETIPQDHGSALQTYLARGGNLLYTTDTRHPYLPPWLATLTGLKLVEGSIIDPGAKNYGLNDPQMLIIDTLGDDRVSDGISQAPLLPTAVAIAEEEAGLKINSALISISGDHILGMNSDGRAQIRNRRISKNDLVHAVMRARQLARKEEQDTLHVLEQQFIVDNHQGITDPVGMIADNLEARVHVISARRAAVVN
ncbi:Gldg family protein, partial [uncultured Cardiobacterium sp.]|uniref:Gldg family protein n=1 Tax=uncultured Cardiobacterium sp. TaxID=417619 RepID=UPI00261730E5